LLHKPQKVLPMCKGRRMNEDLIDMSESTRVKISGFIEREFGIKMPPAKKPLLTSRLGKRLRVSGCRNFEEYFNYVNSPDGLAHEIFVFADLVSTHETSSFREAQHFDVLYNTVLPELLKKNLGSESLLRIWSAGCSTGEEAYSISFACEAFAREKGLADIRYEVTGTDISLKVLEAARRAVYTSDRVKNIPPSYRRYLMSSRDPSADRVRVVPEIRKKTVFDMLNLIMESYPFKESFNIIFCRNTLIYFERDVQEQICKKLLDHLVDGGYLFVGHSESLIGFTLPLKSIIPTVYKKA
jgi:chemotaxis protein methyltransferase CheR